MSRASSPFAEVTNVKRTPGKHDTIVKPRLNSTIASTPKNDEDIAHHLPSQETHNLLLLPSLHEAPLLSTVRRRYDEDFCYSSMGDIILALNPYRDISSRYPTMEKYLSCSFSEMPPHPWEVAKRAYMALRNGKGNQSILISGESGAGKTESTKTVIHFLGEFSCHTCAQMKGHDLSAATRLTAQLNDINPLLEAFGNAKTVRNNNSSRFGKFLQLRFDVGGRLTGASLTNYLLEKCRIAMQSTGERNFHVFYQMLAGCPDCSKYGLTGNPEDYGCLTRGGCTTINGVDDKACYDRLVSAMNTIGITAEEQNSIFEILAAILHLQNINVSQAEDGSSVVSCEGPLAMAAKLLHIAPESLRKALLFQVNMVRNETIVRALSVSQCADTRDALCRCLYDALFTWIVVKLNEVLKGTSSGTSSAEKNEERFIGILDIFGFESLECNGFEQLCINYANESLQQHYNKHVFAQTLTEYAAEGIDVRAVEYRDNQPCIDLFEARPTGMLSLLEAMCATPQATDKSLVTTMNEALVANHSSCYVKSRFAGTKFTVNHYAGPIEYDANGFLARNTDRLKDNLLTMLGNCQHPFIGSLMRVLSPASQQEGLNVPITANGKLLTLAMQFRNQLQTLKSVIESTTPHWIRCIKPNILQSPKSFDPGFVTTQLAYSGVLQTLHMIRNGYPYRIRHAEFLAIFRLLHKFPKDSKDSDEIRCKQFLTILSSKGLLPVLSNTVGAAQVGRTKVFLKQAMHDELYTQLDLVRTEYVNTMARYVRHRLSVRRALDLRRKLTVVVYLQRKHRHRVNIRACCKAEVSERNDLCAVETSHRTKLQDWHNRKVEKITTIQRQRSNLKDSENKGRDALCKEEHDTFGVLHQEFIKPLAQFQAAAIAISERFVTTTSSSCSSSSVSPSTSASFTDPVVLLEEHEIKSATVQSLLKRLRMAERMLNERGARVHELEADLVTQREQANELRTICAAQHEAILDLRKNGSWRQGKPHDHDDDASSITVSVLNDSDDDDDDLTAEEKELAKLQADNEAVRTMLLQTESSAGLPDHDAQVIQWRSVLSQLKAAQVVHSK